METIIDFIFSNFIIVLIIIGGLAKLFGGDNQEQQKKQTNRTPRPVETRKQAPLPQGKMEKPNRQGRAKSETSSSPMGETGSIGEVISVEDQQQKQLEQLAGKMQNETVQSFDDLPNQIDYEHQSFSSMHSKTASPSLQDNNKYKKEVKKQIKKRLSRKGLTESIIMAEVLGPPRARKPYKSVIDERR